MIIKNPFDSCFISPVVPS